MALISHLTALHSEEDMRIQDIENRINSIPTSMSIDTEIEIMEQLMQTDPPDIKSNIKSFKRVIGALEISHMDSGFMEIDSSNEKYVLEFHSWLKILNHDLNMGIANSIIDTFSITEDDARKNMNCGA
nr:hypothetical protein [Luteimonas sp. XNQY3]